MSENKFLVLCQHMGVRDEPHNKIQRETVWQCSNKLFNKGWEEWGRGEIQLKGLSDNGWVTVSGMAAHQTACDTEQKREEQVLKPQTHNLRRVAYCLGMGPLPFGEQDKEQRVR